jgi:hypothetical protein
MIAGYTIFFVLIILYLFSLFIRTRNLNKDLTILESIREHNQATTGRPTGKKPAIGNRPAVKQKTTGPKMSKSNPVKTKVTRKK